ncbi:hypothetical protein F5Y17DRAFT_419028 [Xylariaceae sp. FL0594]|nr:hypothetical protein F5Y17DRAFT_419028 [Xylariaceae sp. FL0594]
MHTKVAIIGSGPAAQSAAIYTARANLKPVLFEGIAGQKPEPLGQLITTTIVENYPGFPDGIDGFELMFAMQQQSLNCGAEIANKSVVKLDVSSRPFKFESMHMEVKNRETVQVIESHTADAIILATGATARRLDLPGEDIYWAKGGVSACATCDGALPNYRQAPLVVIGGGDSAAEEATFLTRFASHVTVLVRRDQLRASSVMAKRLLAHPKVNVKFNTRGVEIKGDGNWMTHLVVEDTVTGQQETIEAKGLFYAIGHDPASSLVKGQLKTDEDGYVVTVPGSSLTSVEGVFAAGDVQDRRYRQAITSAGSGCMAALDAEKFLADMEEDEREGAAKGKI